MFTQYMNTPVGWIKLYGDARGIMEIAFCDKPKKIEDKTTKCISEAITELQEYFDGKRKEFTIPLTFQGTSFQYDVYQALLKIPYGQTKTYRDIAKDIDNPNAAQAVGNALNQNKFAIVVPCHRVVGQGNKISGYLGGAQAHHFLIEHEATHR
jgi:methylated-DNA-[protein]-cysteine S-methyltransferase